MRCKLSVMGGAILLGAGLAAAAPADESLETQSSAQQESQSRGTQVYASPAQVRRIQQRLNQQGFDAGSVDGRWSERTQRAARSFQQAHDLAPTGRLDTDLLAALEMTDILEGEVPGAGGKPESAAGAEGDGAPVHVSPGVVRQVQQQLNRAGFDAGAVDGSWGPSTAEAARKYQRAKGLEPTGTLDLALLQALGLQNALTEGTPQAKRAGALEGTGAPLYLSPAQVRQVQQRLDKEGFNPGAADGIWGSGTREAARSFQENRGLEPTGTLTLPMLATLGLSVTKLTVALAEEDTGAAGATEPSGRQQ